MWCKVTSAGATDYCVGYSFFLDSKNMTAWKENLSLAFCSNLMRSISISQPIHKSLTHSIKLPSMTRLNKYATHLKLHLTSEHLSEWYQRGNLSFVNLAPIIPPQSPFSSCMHHLFYYHAYLYPVELALILVGKNTPSYSDGIRVFAFLHALNIFRIAASLPTLVCIGWLVFRHFGNLQFHGPIKYV